MREDKKVVKARESREEASQRVYQYWMRRGVEGWEKVTNWWSGGRINVLQRDSHSIYEGSMGPRRGGRDSE